MWDLMLNGLAQAVPAAPPTPVVPAASGAAGGWSVAFTVFMVLGVIVALAMTVIIFVTGKGDAMGGGSSSVRTTFKGKSNFDDQMFKVTLGLGLGFMATMLICDFILHQIARK